MHHLFEMAEDIEHGLNRFDNHTLIQFKQLAHLEIGRIAAFGMETMVRKYHRLPIKVLDQGVKGGIMDISCNKPSRLLGQGG